MQNPKEGLFFLCFFAFEAKWKNFRPWTWSAVLGPSKRKPRELHLHFCATNQQRECVKVPCPQTRLTFLWSPVLRGTHRGPRALIQETVGDSLRAQLCHNEQPPGLGGSVSPKDSGFHISCILTSLNYKAAAIYTKRDMRKGKNS